MAYLYVLSILFALCGLQKILDAVHGMCYSFLASLVSTAFAVVKCVNLELIAMSKICEVCGKKPSAGRNVSHSHRVTNRWFKPNIQKITIRDKSGHVRKANVCTSCMKAGKVERA